MLIDCVGRRDEVLLHTEVELVSTIWVSAQLARTDRGCDNTDRNNM